MPKKSFIPPAGSNKTSPLTPSSIATAARTDTDTSAIVQSRRYRPNREELHHSTKTPDKNVHALERSISILLSSDTDDDIISREQDATETGEAIVGKDDGLRHTCCCLASSSGIFGVTFWLVTAKAHSHMFDTESNVIFLVFVSLVLGFCCALFREPLCDSCSANCCSTSATSGSRSKRCCGPDDKCLAILGIHRDPHGGWDIPLVLSIPCFCLGVCGIVVCIVCLFYDMFPEIVKWAWSSLVYQHHIGKS